MNSSVIFPLLVNVVVGIWLIAFYPRSVRKHFPEGRIPPAFATLARVMPVVGGLIIAASVIYAIYTLRGAA